MKMIQIRNVPDDLHRKLKARASLKGMSLSDYLLSEMRRTAERPTIEEIRCRLENKPLHTLSQTPAEAVRAERNNR